VDAVRDARPGRPALVTPVRAAIAVALLLLAALEWRLLHPPGYHVFDVQGRAHEIARASPAEKSLTDTYYMGPGGSAHLHILGRAIICGLHLHEHTEEATVPVMGEPRSPRSSRGGQRRRCSSIPSPGAARSRGSPIAPAILIVIDGRDATMTIVADAGHPLALYAVRMPN
jgi:hypothetical protein